ncbi:fructose-1-6-bisphosphatase [Helicosporidium sp. ATCC 50920]|nr:fructose-1-6-bisphosphatase [Helicosporidium sp. ATCC 50920]|eukprot:KDD74496.1 fructose-1-6-bisphosphatase [Helicosporidium sp. ATCC 50920]
MTQASEALLQTDPFTLSSYVLSNQHLKAPEAKGHLTLLLNAISTGCKFVSMAVQRAGVAGSNVLGQAGSTNVQGEDQKTLDIVANEVFKNVLRKSGQCAVLVTEEEEEPIFIAEPHRGQYCVVFDPLDGSSNIECGVSIGTIFGIYRVKDGSTGSLADVLRPGSEMVAAGYCMYGSMTYMMLSIGDGIAGFTLVPNLGEFVLSHNNLRLPEQGKIYSINVANISKWDEATRQYVHECREGNPLSFSNRYVGSMVADVHRTLLYGGIFMYPADAKNPRGKLRMLYEGFPMAFLVEQAGGRAIDSDCKRILDVMPEHIHDRCPIYLGSKAQVDRVEELYKAQ